MDTTYILGLGFGMLAALLMNVGKGVQKQKVEVLTYGRAMFGPEHRRDFVIWLLGTLMTASSTVPWSMGLKLSESPSVISAMTGVGLTGLVMYAIFVIGEKAGMRDWVGIVLVVLSTSILGYLGGEQGVRDFATGDLLLSTFILIAVAGAGCLVARFRIGLHGLAWGSAAGLLIGLALFLGDAALVRAGGDFLGQLSTPYPYLALLSGAVAIGATQVGFFKGRALEVVPAINSATLLTPLVLEWVMYDTLPGLYRIIAIVVMLTGVLMLSTGAAAKAAAGG